MNIEAINEKLNDDYKLRNGVLDAKTRGKFTLYRETETFDDGTYNNFFAESIYGRPLRSFGSLKSAEKYIKENNLSK